MIFVCGSSWSTGVFEKNVSWADYLGEMLNMEVVNYSSGGVGNDYIVRRTLEYFKDNTANLCIINWAPQSRREYMINGEWAYIVPWFHDWDEKSRKMYENNALTKPDWKEVRDFHVKYLHDDKRDYVNTDNYYTLLTTYLKYKDIPYLCFSVDDYTNDDPYFMKDRMYYVCKEYLNKYNHPNPEGHKIWAQKVYDALNVPIGNMSVMDGVNAS